MLDDKGFLAPVSMMVKKETKRAVDIESERENRHRKFVDVPYNTGARSAPSSDRSPTDIFNEWTNNKAYSETLEKEDTFLSISNDVTDGNKSKQYETGA